MADHGSNKENDPASASPGPSNSERFAFSSMAQQDSSMYSALGTFNAEQRKNELKILAEEDFVAHLTSVRENLQLQNEEQRKRVNELRLNYQVMAAENQSVKSKKEGIQKEIQENEAALTDMHERLAKKRNLVDKLKTARAEKQAQFAMLIQRREEFHEALFEESPEGQLYRQVKQEVTKLQQILQNRHHSRDKLESELKLKRQEQNKQWEEFTKKCIKIAECFVNKNKHEHSRVDLRNNYSKTGKSSGGWNDLYQIMLAKSSSREIGARDEDGFLRPFPVSFGPSRSHSLLSSFGAQATPTPSSAFGAQATTSSASHAPPDATLSASTCPPEPEAYSTSSISFAQAEEPAPDPCPPPEPEPEALDMFSYLFGPSSTPNTFLESAPNTDNIWDSFMVGKDLF